MTEEVNKIEIDYSQMLEELEERMEAKQKAKAEAEAQRKADIEEHVKKALELQKEKHEEELKDLRERKTAPAFNQRVGKNSKIDEATDEFIHWMKTGDNGMERVLKYDPMQDAVPAGRKALQVGSDTEGGYLAPEGFLNEVIAKRDQISWVRNSGVRVITVGGKNLQVPVITTKMSVFAPTAEEAAYSDSDPIFGEVDITVYKFTRTNKFSEELLDDEAVNLDSFYAAELGRAWARTESQYVTTGTGSAQPQGIFATDGATAGLTFDSSGNITADEIPELFYKLGNGYRQGAVWLMNDDTEGYLRKVRDANNWAFDAFQMVSNVGAMGDWKYETFYGGRPIFTESNISTMGASADVICIGNMEFYALVERQGLAVARNPYLYQANGQVGFFAKVRWGGAVLQSEAFQVGSMSA